MVLVLFLLQSTGLLSSLPQRWVCLSLIDPELCRCYSFSEMLLLLDVFSVSSLFLLCSLEAKKICCNLIYFFLNVHLLFSELNSAFIFRFAETPLSGVERFAEVKNSG